MLFGFIRTNLRVFLLLLHLLPSLSFKLLIRFEQFFILFQTFATCRICNVFFQIYIYIIFLSRKKEYKSASCIAWFLRLLFGFNWNFKRILCRKKKRKKSCLLNYFIFENEWKKLYFPPYTFLQRQILFNNDPRSNEKKKKEKFSKVSKVFPNFRFINDSSKIEIITPYTVNRAVYGIVRRE